jgi:hypothetical protein
LCNRHDKGLTASEQIEGCDDQRFRPVLVPGEVVEVHDDRIDYRMTNGELWSDEGADD